MCLIVQPHTVSVPLWSVSKPINVRRIHPKGVGYILRRDTSLLHGFGQREETGEPEGYPLEHRDSMQKSTNLSSGSKPRNLKQ